MRPREAVLSTLPWLLGVAIFATATTFSDRIPRRQDPREIDAVLPRWTQILLSAGDRFLAANLATIRALIPTIQRLTPDQVDLLTRLHLEASWLNPANEDNYYVSANVLPWNGKLAESDRVLHAATAARPFDWMPAFYLGFNRWYFDHDVKNAVSWIRQAEKRADSEQNRIALEVMATRWLEKGYDTATAIRLLEGMVQDAKHGKLKRYYATRVDRLKGLLALEEAAGRFRSREGRAPRELAELVSSRDIDRLPLDPWGFGYALTPQGTPVLLNSKPKS